MLIIPHGHFSNLPFKRRLIYSSVIFVRLFTNMDVASIKKFRAARLHCASEQLLREESSLALENFRLPLVSIIIPAYNASVFIERCLDSVYRQTYSNFEVIAVNDGSTDDTLNILEAWAASKDNFTLVDQANAGQGSARNTALELANGTYILFIDADDFIEPVTLQMTVQRALVDQSDLVHFDWKLFDPSPERSSPYHYYNSDPFWHRSILEGPECDELLRVQNLFSVCNLYRAEFLRDNDIRFEEGRIYEDNPFVLQCVNRAEKISLVHAPLYTVNPHPNSSTRTNTLTDKHCRDHIFAIGRSFQLLDRRNPRSAAYLGAYHTKKFAPYYQKRVPTRYKHAYVRAFVEALHQARIDVPPNTSTNRPFRFAMRTRVFEKKRVAFFHCVVVAQNFFMPKLKKAKARLRAWKHRNDPNSIWSRAIEEELREPIRENVIAFLGLDFRYVGNSRYLFEQLVKSPDFEQYDVYYVTNDPAVPAEHRLKPGLLETNRALARAKMIVAESWIPPKIRKHRDSTWVQLWHGTPLKRMLFDSHEARIMQRRRGHKVAKYRDIQNWDYLVVDSPAAKEKFQTAFLFESDRMLPTGYPRVEYLIDNANNIELKETTLERLGIDRDTDKTILLYAPTWRDYNYEKNKHESDFEYLLDVGQLANDLGDDYLILFHDHSYLSANLHSENDRCIEASSVEIQDLLIASDIIISDYSSVIFDALPINRPILLYATDTQKYEEHRGVYEDIWKDFHSYAVSDTASLIHRVHSLRQEMKFEYPDVLLKKYAYSQQVPLLQELKNFMRQ